jgi:hypothetical protein
VEDVMNVYVVQGEHDNGSWIVGVYKDEAHANDIAEMYQDQADAEHNIVEFTVDVHTVE